MPQASTQKIDESTIRERAYYLWEQDGKPFGRDLDYWTRAATTSSAKPKARAARAGTAVKARGARG